MTRQGGISTEMFLSRAEELSTQEELRALIWEELRWEPFLNPHDVRVHVEGTEVHLSGVVKNYYGKLAAEHAAKRVHCVQTVRSEIAVDVPLSDRHSDDELRAALEQKMDWDVRISHGRIIVDVKNGSVTVVGEVETEYERNAVDGLVRRCRGVRSIANLITVEAQLPHQTLRPEVEAELRRHAELHGDHIRVETHGGAVVLHGTVRSLAEREEAEKAARSVPGVTHLEDDLKVRKRK